nr:methionyl-tRNA formyltransferase [Chloroflexota bacterium]
MERIVFMGTPRFGQLILEALIGHYEVVAVVTQPDREGGRGRKVIIPPVKALALAHNLSVLQPVKVRQPEFVQQLHDLAPTAIVVAAFGQILPPTILSLPPYGCINVHASLLPRHRGAAPIPAAILAGDAQTGVTIMLMDEGLDTGPILGQAALEILPDDTTASLTERLGNLGGQLILDTLPRWLAGEITPQKQDDRLVTYSKLLRKEDGHIRWTEPAELIARKCRAFYPWPGAFTFWGERELKVLRARPCLAPYPERIPGKVIRVNSEIAVVTGEGLLVLEEVQLAGKRPLTGPEFVRGQRDFVGSLLQ